MHDNRIKRGLESNLDPWSQKRTNVLGKPDSPAFKVPDYFKLKNGVEGGDQITPAKSLESEGVREPGQWLAAFKDNNQYHFSPHRLKALDELRQTIQNPNTSVFDIIDAYQTGQSIGLDRYLSDDIYNRFGSTTKLPSLTDPIYQDLARMHELASQLGIDSIFRIPPQSKAIEGGGGGLPGMSPYKA